MATSHVIVAIPLGRRQLRHRPPPEGCALVPWTCIGRDSVLLHVGLLLSVAVKFTVKVLPTWLWLGVKVKVPVVGSKPMLEANPVAESMTVPPVPVGSLPDIVKRRFPPTVAFMGPGIVIVGRTSAETTVMTT